MAATAPDLSDLWLDWVEIPLDEIGLGNPAVRLLVFGLGTAAVLYVMKPKAFFDINGNAYPWVLFTSPNDPLALPLNWLAFSAFVGAMAVLFL